MKNRYVTVRPDTFRSWLIPAAAVFYGIAALCGLCSVVFLPGSVGTLVEDLIAGGITEASAIRSWKLIHICVTVAAFVFPTVMAAGYILALRGQPGKGLVMLCNVFEWLVKAVNASGIVVVVIFIYRVIRYAVGVLPMDEGMYLLYAMLVSEGVMAVQAGVLFVLLRRFLNAICDSAASIADTLENGRLGARSIPGFAATGFLLLALLTFLVGLDRLFTMVIVQEYRSSHYAFLTAEHPLLILSGCALLLGAMANILSAFYLRRFKRTSERLFHQSSQSKI